jgi:hypothetical protein
MGFTLKSTKKLLGRLGNKNRSRQKREDEHSNNSAKQVMEMMAELNNNSNGNSNNNNNGGPQTNRTNKPRRSASAKRLLSSFTISRRGRPANNNNNPRQNRRRASIETAKVSSLDFQSSRLYRNDSDMEEHSHSSYSADCSGSSLALQGQLQQQHSQRISIFSSPPPVRIVEGNSSEEFSSGSIRKRVSHLQNLDAHVVGDDVATDDDFRPVPMTMMEVDGDDADETERSSNVSFADYPIKSSCGVVVHGSLIEPINDVGDDDYDIDFIEASRLTRPSSDRPKRASGCSEISNLSDDDEEDEDYDHMGVCYNNNMMNTNNAVDFHLEFVPSDLRADYLLVYDFLQEEALLASIQDSQWRTQVRSARLRANIRHHLSQINE